MGNDTICSRFSIFHQFLKKSDKTSRYQILFKNPLRETHKTRTAAIFFENSDMFLSINLPTNNFALQYF